VRGPWVGVDSSCASADPSARACRIDRQHSPGAGTPAARRCPNPPSRFPSRHHVTHGGETRIAGSGPLCEDARRGCLLRSPRCPFQQFNIRRCGCRRGSRYPCLGSARMASAQRISSSGRRRVSDVARAIDHRAAESVREFAVISHGSAGVTARPRSLPPAACSFESNDGGDSTCASALCDCDVPHGCR